jgi:hypothetical protein
VRTGEQFAKVTRTEIFGKISTTDADDDALFCRFSTNVTDKDDRFSHDSSVPTFQRSN